MGWCALRDEGSAASLLHERAAPGGRKRNIVRPWCAGAAGARRVWCGLGGSGLARYGAYRAQRAGRRVRQPAQRGGNATRCPYITRLGVVGPREYPPRLRLRFARVTFTAMTLSNFGEGF